VDQLFELFPAWVALITLIVTGAISLFFRQSLASWVLIVLAAVRAATIRRLFRFKRPTLVIVVDDQERDPTIPDAPLVDSDGNPVGSRTEDEIENEPAGG
jgi:hypothetical protein